MAEAAVNFALSTLSSLLIQQTELLGRTETEVRSIQNELESIRSFLKDEEAKTAAEEEGERNEGVLTWVKQVREVAYRIEDVIDEFSSTMAQLPDGTGFLGLCKISRFFKKLIVKPKIAKEVQCIKSSIDEIDQRAQRYNLKPIYQGSSSGTGNVIQRESRIDSLFVDDSEVVGIESTRDELIDRLVNGSKQRSVIVLVGQGGQGKTTLAWKIYERVKLNFKCRAWITVGKESSRKDLLRKIVQEFDCQEQLQIEKMDEIELTNTLRAHLEKKSYMVVFDDVWKSEFWGEVERALIDNGESSRIMLTTRNRGVVGSLTKSIAHVEELQPLPLDKAWELFCKNAFRPDGPSELREFSENIVAKCGGLPLAIVAVGGLLSTKNKAVSEWQKFHDGLGSKLRSDPHLRNCNMVLSESYHDLPYHLKPCLLYFGVFLLNPVCLGKQSLAPIGFKNIRITVIPLQSVKNIPSSYEISTRNF